VLSAKKREPATGQGVNIFLIVPKKKKDPSLHIAVKGSEKRKQERSRGGTVLGSGRNNFETFGKRDGCIVNDPCSKPRGEGWEETCREPEAGQNAAPTNH